MASRKIWLVKEEPDSYPFSELQREGRVAWEGVRNHQARNNLEAMRKGDWVLYYHTGKERAVVGLARVSREAFPDGTSDDPRWLAVELEPVKPLARAVTLAEIKADAAFRQLTLVRNSRLSVQPVSREHFELLLELSGTRLPH